MRTTLSDPLGHDMDAWPAKLAAPASEEQVAAVKAAVQVIAAGGQQPTPALVAVVAARLLRQALQPQQNTPAAAAAAAAEHNPAHDGGWGAITADTMVAALPCFDQLELYDLASSTWHTDANVAGSSRNRSRLFKATTGRHILDMQPQKAPLAASGSSVGRTKGRVTCQVAGCLQDLTAGRESYTGESCSPLSPVIMQLTSVHQQRQKGQLPCRQLTRRFSVARLLTGRNHSLLTVYCCAAALCHSGRYRVCPRHMVVSS